MRVAVATAGVQTPVAATAARMFVLSEPGTCVPGCKTIVAGATYQFMDRRRAHTGLRVWQKPVDIQESCKLLRKKSFTFNSFLEF